MNGDDRRVALRKACDQGDEVMLEQLGWRPVMDALRFWRKRLDGDELAPYVKLLGDQEPDEVADVITELAGEAEYRPGPAQIYMRLQGGRLAETQGRGRGPSVTPAGGPRVPKPRPDQTPEAHQAVLEAVAAGELVCECFPRPADVNVDAFDVQRCPDCEGIEVGQYEQALEALAGDAP